MLRALCAFLAVFAASCAHERVPPSDAQVAAAIAADMLFGGATAFERKLLADTQLVAGDDMAARERFFAEWRPRLDRAAAARTRTAIDGADVDAVTRFLASDAGRAFTKARETAIAMNGCTWPEFATTTAAVYGDPEQVGKANVGNLIQATQERLAAGNATGSPHVFAVRIAAAHVEPPEAREIAAFCATAAGARWLAAEAAAIDNAEDSWKQFRMAALETGVVRERNPGFGKLPPYQRSR